MGRPLYKNGKGGKEMKRNPSFKFNGNELFYLDNEYNSTSLNERSVEIPIVLSICPLTEGVLEVGNVLNHYYGIDHPVVDIKEEGRGVINEDIRTVRIRSVFSRSISISTIEHIGGLSDMIDAINKIKLMLSPGGELICTLPIGYRKEANHLVFDCPELFSNQWFMKRISDNNEWEQVEKKDVRGVKYGRPWKWANSIMIGRCKK